MTQKSSDQLLESLSALVDNEASELEVRRILKNVELNPEVRDRWRSYNLIGSVIRKEANLNLGGNLTIAERVSLAVHSEQVLSETSSLNNSSFGGSVNSVAEESVSRRKGFVEFMAKSAIAASFAGALVVGFNVLSPNNTAEMDGTSGRLAGVTNAKQLVDPDLTAPVGFELPRLESRTVSAGGLNSNAITSMATPSRLQAFDLARMDDLSDPATQYLLNDLLIRHAARASANGNLGMMPYARVSQMQQVGSSE